MTQNPNITTVGTSVEYFHFLILWKPKHQIFIICWNILWDPKSNLCPLLVQSASQERSRSIFEPPPSTIYEVVKQGGGVMLHEVELFGAASGRLLQSHL